jgi:hypothetical protein
MINPFEEIYPNIARWVTTYGWIEIGQDDYNSSFVRVLDEGGMVWEGSDDYETLDEAMQALEAGLAEWMKQ